MTMDDTFSPVQRKMTDAMRRDFAHASNDTPKIARQLPPHTQSWEALWLQGWQYPRYQTDWRQVCAIVPTYLPDGQNGCVVYYIDGSSDVCAHRVEWVLDNILDYLHTSKHILHSQSVAWMGGTTRRRVPLIAHPDFCLVPVNCRSSVRRNDSCTGYVVLRHISKVQSYATWRACHRDMEDVVMDFNYVYNGAIEEADILSMISFHSSYKLAVRDRLDTLHTNLYLAHRLWQRYTQLHAHDAAQCLQPAN